jgi:hypothetical protein
LWAAWRLIHQPREETVLVSEILRIKGHTLFTTPPERSVLEALASAMSTPLYTVSKRWGIVSLTLACLTGLAMIFVGINYPFDVFTGLFVGSAVGYTARQLVQYSGKASALRLCMVWSGVLVWGIFIAYTVKPATAVAERSLQTPVTSSVMVAPPDAVMKALTSISKTEKVKL